MRNGEGMIRLKRVYESPATEDGFRVLVERLWPRGITKAEAHLDLRMREIAPSIDLRKWFAMTRQKGGILGAVRKGTCSGNSELN